MPINLLSARYTVSIETTDEFFFIDFFQFNMLLF